MPDEIRVQVRTPAELEAGLYANFMSVWHTAYEFTLDFAVILPTEESRADDGTITPIAPAKVTARVKIPPGLVFNVMRALNESLAAYEAQFGAQRGKERDE